MHAWIQICLAECSLLSSIPNSALTRRTSSCAFTSKSKVLRILGIVDWCQTEPQDTNHFQLRLHKRCTEMYLLAICIQVFSVFYLTDAVTHLEIYPGLQCSYNYDLEVHTHRGERSTKELNFKINARVSFGDICSCDFYATLYILFTTWAGRVVYESIRSLTI